MSLEFISKSSLFNACRHRASNMPYQKAVKKTEPTKSKCKYKCDDK